MENQSGSHDRVNREIRVWGSKMFPHGFHFQGLRLKV